MSEADVERLREAFEAFERGETDRAYARLADDFQVVDHVILEDTSEARGPAALAENIGELLKAFERVSYEILEVVDLEGTVLLRVNASARAARDGGLDTHLEVGQVWTVRDGLATKLEIFASWEEAKRAAGLDA